MTAHEKGVHLRPMLERIRRERGENPGAAGEEGGS